MVNSQIVNSLIDFEFICERLAILTTEDTIKIRILSTKAPTDTNPDLIKNNFKK